MRLAPQREPATLVRIVGLEFVVVDDKFRLGVPTDGLMPRARMPVTAMTEGPSAAVTAASSTASCSRGCVDIDTRFSHTLLRPFDDKAHHTGRRQRSDEELVGPCAAPATPRVVGSTSIARASHDQ